MRPPLNAEKTANVFFFATLAFCLMLAVLSALLAIRHGGNDLHSFAEPVLTLSDGWTLTDGAGQTRAIRLPETIPCSADGVYTLSGTLPRDTALIASPAFCFYSNYVDCTIAVDGRVLYAFPAVPPAFSGATGNTYHFVRLPTDYAGKTVAITLRCQLGDDITYLLKPPLIGAKATMISRETMRSLPAFTLAGCMNILAIALAALYFVFRKRLDLNYATLFTAMFSLLFSVYVYFETSFAQLLMPNGYLLCFTTLTLLMLLPMPLVGIFSEAVFARYKPVMRGLMALCAANLVVQMILNFTGVMSVRSMLPATHAVLVVTILTVSLCLLLSGRHGKSGAVRSLLSAAPMIAGGLADIALLAVNRPSPNNSLWFTLGVTAFIVHQMCGFIAGYFSLYRTSLESKLLAKLAYHDLLSGIDNRNAYEQKLKELSGRAAQERLCCIVADINDLKVINDTLGHAAGDTAIAEIGALLHACTPADASFFRTGGDEFVVLLEESDEEKTRALAEQLVSEAARRGQLRSVPISLAIGYGQYEAADGNIVDFIRRIDTRMYACKRKQKNGNGGACVRPAEG